MGTRYAKTCWVLYRGGAGESLRITLNRRLATAAPAIVKRMINRRRPRVLRPVSPFRKGSKAAATMIDAADEVNGPYQRRFNCSKNRSCFLAALRQAFLPAAGLRGLHLIFPLAGCLAVSCLATSPTLNFSTNTVVIRGYESFMYGPLKKLPLCCLSYIGNEALFNGTVTVHSC